MGKFDVSKIEGYNDMTPEQKIAAIEAFEMPDPDYSGFVKKDVYDKTASELSKLKKEHNDRLSEDEREKQATDEELTKLREEVADLKKKELVAAHKAQYLAMGYDESLADATAKALADGDTKKVFDNQRKFLETHDKSIKAELLKDTPTPPAGEGGDEMTKEKFDKLSPQERYKYSVDHPDDYKKLYDGGTK